jgi:hypothetical protein
MGCDIAIVREQCYMLSPLSYFRVAGIFPDGRVSGRFYCPCPGFALGWYWTLPARPRREVVASTRQLL